MSFNLASFLTEIESILGNVTKTAVAVQTAIPTELENVVSLANDLANLVNTAQNVVATAKGQVIPPTTTTTTTTH